MAVHLPPFPPFGFSVWFDRHNGRKWCWRDRRATDDKRDVTYGDGFDTKTDAVLAVRHEIRRRKERREADVSPSPETHASAQDEHGRSSPSPHEASEDPP